MLEVVNGSDGDIYALSGSVKNGRKKRGRQIYGMVFDEPGKANCRRLLKSLTYDGTKYIFKSPKQDHVLGI
ncbi:hypothetical protein [Grimontia hollisae]|uniref:hypothetical protein n=1 Tax=Grimontia hollisae TaxID=673 RepID=UPI001E5ADC6C|nr:hypothetical protein [Grimontia hollisae]